MRIPVYIYHPKSGTKYMSCYYDPLEIIILVHKFVKIHGVYIDPQILVKRTIQYFHTRTGRAKYGKDACFLGNMNVLNKQKVSEDKGTKGMAEGYFSLIENNWIIALQQKPK